MVDPERIETQIAYLDHCLLTHSFCPTPGRSARIGMPCSRRVAAGPIPETMSS